jgi:hypothetical protein
MGVYDVTVDIFDFALLLLIGVLIEVHVIVLVCYLFAGNLICEHLD